jgi:fatty-acyl-CoA synthase
MTKPSYVHGACGEPLLGETIGGVFARAVAAHGGRDALIVRAQGIRWSYAALAAEAEAFAAGLVALGLQPGERIGIWSQNRAEWIVTMLAAAQAGLILVNVNPAYRLSELEYALNKVECAALVTATKFKTSDYIGMVQALAPELAACAPGELRAAKLPHLRLVIQMPEIAAPGPAAPGCLSFAAVAGFGTDAAREALARLAAAIQFDAPVNIQFTSGTTGNPKGATLTHHNIVNNGYFVGRAIRMSEQDRLCIPVPMYHCFGMVMSALACISHGAAMVFPGEGFDPLAVLQTVAAERCTALYGVPTMFIAELDHPEFDSFDLSSLRTGIMAGSPCPIEVMRRVISRMNMKDVTIAYGMTETSPVSFQSAVDDSMEHRVKIIDSEGRIVPRGVAGELCTRGYPVMLGYWGDPERTAQAIDAAGWMHTGDLATIDEDGFGNIVGRIKDLVIRGGENVYPREIEEFLYRHPHIADVQVFGVPDPRYGEEIAAWIKLRPGEVLTEIDIKTFCQGQIAHYKVPRYVKFVDEFPMTVTGKMQKYLMREAMAAELGLSADRTA